MAWTTATPKLHITIILLQGILALGILTGCGSMNILPQPVRPTAVQQFLMTQAVERSLNGENTMPIPLAYGDTVSLDTIGLNAEQHFLKSAIVAWLGERGLKFISESQNARYRVVILVQALGTEQRESLFGMPAVQGGLLPFALPELALFKAQKQSGYTRFRLDIYETATGQFIRSTPWFQGSTYFNEYTVLFFLDFETTDLIAPF